MCSSDLGVVLGDVDAHERAGLVGGVAQRGGQLGEEAVEVAGDELRLALEETVAGIPGQDHLPAARQSFDGGDALEERARRRCGAVGSGRDRCPKRVEVLAEVLVSPAVPVGAVFGAIASTTGVAQ